MYIQWYQGYNVDGEFNFVMRFVFFECRNKVGAACAQLLLGSSGFFYLVKGYLKMRQKFEREDLENA